MEKKYVYRKHLREPSKMFAFGCVLFVTLYSIIIATMLMSREEPIELKHIAVLALIGVGVILVLGIEFLILYFTVYRRFKKISLELKDDVIVYTNLKGTTIIPYEQIVKIKFPSIRYIGGWMKIVYNDGRKNRNIKMTVVLQGIGDLIFNLKQKMDSLGINNVYKKNKVFNFYKTAKYSDASWERIYEYIKKFTVFIVVNLIVGFIFANLTDDINFKLEIIFITWLLPFIVYIICEIILGIKTSIKTVAYDFYIPDRDKKFEGKLFKIAFSLYFVLYIVGGVVLIVL